MSEADRWLNKLIACLRIRVEHTLAGVKRCRSVKDLLRNTKPGYSDLLMVVACGLHNWRMEHRHPLPSFNLLAFVLPSNFG